MIVDFNTSLNKVNKNRVGEKFYNLYLLYANLKFDIPPAFCITNSELDYKELDSRINYTKKYAIRSSSNMEDQIEQSAAGMFTTYLNITGKTEIINYIKKCFESAQSENARQYFKQKSDLKITNNLAVIVQEMVDAEKAGVLFTRNPVTGADEFIIEYTYGVAEKLMDGQVDPQRVIIPKSELSMNNSLLKELCNKGKKAEDFFNMPQDIEWAINGDKIYILQSRPITAIMNRPRDLSQIWTRANIGEIIPRPLTPLSWDVFRKVIFNSYRFGFYGIHDRIIMNLIHLIPKEFPNIDSPKLFMGTAYLNLDTVRITFSFEPWVDEKVLNIGLGFQFQKDELNKNLKLSTRLIQFFKKIEFYLEIIFPSLSFENRGFRFVQKKLKNSYQGNKDFKTIVKRIAFIFGWHIAATARSFSILGYVLNKTESGEKGLNLIDSLSRDNNDEFVSMLSTIQRMVDSDNKLKECINNNDLKNYLLWDGFNDFKNSFSSFLKKYGHRSENEFELRQKNWQNEPSLLKNVILNSNKLQSNKCYPSIKNKLQIKLLKVFRLRENLKDLLIRSYNDLKVYFIEEGNSLGREGIIYQMEDIYFLQLHEIWNYKSLGHQEIKRSIQQRKFEFENNGKRQMPYTFTGVDLPAPKSAVFREFRPMIKGLGCSKGVICAKAVYVNTLQDSCKLNRGDILVTTSTDPGWTPLFLIAGGVITEIGGMLSHTATIAREYGIPMISAVPEIVNKIKDGMLIEMDGGSGSIRILE